MKRIASRAYIDGAKGETCKLRIAGVCRGGRETTVFAHIRDGHAGRSIKASDVSGADACFWCHAKFDGQAGEPLPRELWLLYALRGMQETLENRIARGIVKLKLDEPKQREVPVRKKADPNHKPRPIRSQGFRKGGPKQKIPNRPFPKKGEK